MSWEPEGIEHSCRVVLGLAISDAANLRFAERLTPEDMTPLAFGVILTEIRAMAKHNLPIDAQTLIARFSARRLAEIGGRDPILQLTEKLPRHTKDLPAHVNAILEESNRRRAQTAIFSAQKAIDDGGDLTQIKDRFLEQFARITSTSKAEPSHARLVQLSTVSAKAVEWLWDPLLPLGMLSMVSGDSDVGKTFMLQAIAASLTLGLLPCGGGRCEPINVLHMTNENSPEHVLRPRFDLLGGDANRYYHCPGSEWTDESGEVHQAGITLADIPMLDDALTRSRAKMVLIDPIQSYLPSKTDSHKAADVRAVLDPLAKLAEKHQCSIVLIRHLNKGSGGKAIYRGSMSIDFSAAVRSEMLVGYLPDDHSKRAVVHVIHNLGPAAQSIGFQIDGSGEFSWTGRTDITAEQLLADPTNESREVAGALKEACEWLKDFLTPNSQTQQDCRSQAELAGIRFASLRRAKTVLGVRSRKTAFKGSFIWFMPEVNQGPSIPEPLEPLGANPNKARDFNRLNDLSHLGQQKDDLSHLGEPYEAAQQLSHFDETHPSGSSKNTTLNHFGKYNNNKDLSVYPEVTSVEVAQVSRVSPRAREANGFDPAIRERNDLA